MKIMKKNLMWKRVLLLMMSLKAIPALASAPDLNTVLETSGAQDEIAKYSTFDDLYALAQTDKRLRKNVKSRWLWPFYFKIEEEEFQKSFSNMSLRFLPLSLTFHLQNKTPEMLAMIPETTKFSKRPYEKVLSAARRGDFRYAQDWPDPDLDSFGRFAIACDQSYIFTTHIDVLRDLSGMHFDESLRKKQIIRLAMDLVFHSRMDRDDPINITLSFDLNMRDLKRIWDKLKQKPFDHYLLPKFIAQKLEEPLKTEVCEFYKNIMDNNDKPLDDRLKVMKTISKLITPEESGQQVKAFQRIIDGNEDISVKLDIVDALVSLNLDESTQNRLANLVLSFEMTPDMQIKSLKTIRKLKLLNKYLKAAFADLSLHLARNPQTSFQDKLELLTLSTSFTNEESRDSVISILNNEGDINHQNMVLFDILKLRPYDESIKERYESIIDHPNADIFEKFIALGELLKQGEGMVLLDRALELYLRNPNDEALDNFLRQLETLPEKKLMDVYLKVLETPGISLYIQKNVLHRLFKIDVDKKNEVIMIRLALENINHPETDVYIKLDFLEFLVKFDRGEDLRAHLTEVCDQMKVCEYDQYRIDNVRANLIP